MFYRFYNELLFFPCLTEVKPRNVWLIFAEINVEIIISRFFTTNLLLDRGPC